MKGLKILSTVIVATVAAVAPITLLAYEEPKYAVVQNNEVFEVRRYEPYIVAEVVVPGPADKAGNQGFGILADYIFGKNRGAVKMEMTAPVNQIPAPVTIDMTAPVAQSATQGGFLVQFVMPRAFTMATLPEPLDSRVKLREVAEQTYAVIRYSGGSGQANYNKNLEKLRKAVKQSGITTQGEPLFARYNPPFVPPFMRRNEIWLRMQ
jgi:SOUL heme-binding protein